jgi:hypothetical protein
VELFDMMSRWETMTANLPVIQQRLIALNELHQQGKIFDRKNVIIDFSLIFSFSIQYSTFTL